MLAMNDVIGSLDILHCAWMKHYLLKLSSDFRRSDFPFDQVGSLCDVGSGIGGFAIPLAKAYPHIKITMQDLPGTIEQAKQVKFDSLFIIHG